MSETGVPDPSLQWRNGHFVTENKKRPWVNKLFDMIGFLLSIGLVFMGYSYGKSISDRRTTAVITPIPDFSLFTPTPVIPTQVPGELSFALDTSSSASCIIGYQSITADSYSLCVPDGFVETATDQAARHLIRDSEELIIYNANQQFPLHICHLETPVKVGEYDATRIRFHEPNGPGCGAITGFALTIAAASQGDYTIHMFKKSGVYENEEVFNTVADSFTFR